jgi:hypothetical protein
LQSERTRSAFLSLAGAGTLLNDTIKEGRTAWIQNNALTKEAEQRYATMASNISEAFNSIKAVAISFEDIIKPAVNGFTDGVKRIAGVLDALSEESKIKILKIAALLAAGGPLLLAFTGVIKAVSFMSTVLLSKFALISAGIASVVVSGQWFYDNWNKIELGLSNIGGAIVLSFQEMGRGIMIALREVVDFILTKIPPVAVAELFGIDVTGWVNDVAGINGAIDSLNSTIEKGQQDLTRNIGYFNKMAFGTITESAKKALELTVNTLKNGLKGILNNTEINSLMEEIQGKWQSIGLNVGGASESGGGGASESGVGGASNGELPDPKDLGQFRVNLEGLIDPMDRLNDKFGEVNKSAMRTATLGEYIGQRLGEAFAQAVVFGDKLLDTLKNIGKQLASKAIIKFISLAIGGGLGGLIGGGLLSGIGKLIGVNDALIQKDGTVVKFHPDDNILAMKDFSGLIPSRQASSGGGVIHNVINLDSRVIYESIEKYKDRIR